LIAGILLASGASRRFGSDKLLASLGDRPVIRWSAEALAPAVDALFVVVSPESAALRDALAGLPVRWVVNEESHTGMASSIRAGIAALPPEAEAAIVALGDQPLLNVAVADRVVACWRSTTARAAAPLYEDGRGHPVLFDASLFPALLALEGDSGARTLLDGLGADLSTVPIAACMPVDVDTPEALEKVAAELARRAPPTD
jgi:molybdenum cofactor cytidylyltransferase